MANPQAEPRESYNLDSAAAALDDFAGNLLGIEGDDEPEQDEPEAEDTEDAEAEAAEPDEDVETEGEEAEPETVELETLDDVAKALGVDPADLLANLKMKIKVNGEERLVSLAEAQKGNQFEADYRQKTSARADERRAFHTERDQHMQQINQVAASAAASIQVAEQLLMAELNSPVMAELRTTNPAEWNARQTEANQKMQYLHQARNQAQQQYAQAVEAQSAQQQQWLSHYLAEQEQHLTTKVQDWTPDRKTSVAQFLGERYGYSQEELGGVMDHRLVMMALDAQKGATLSQQAEKVVAKVKTLPKLQAPGKPKSALTIRAKQIAGLKGRLKQTGHVRDAAKLIENLL